jgi:hypothetical protein
MAGGIAGITKHPEHENHALKNVSLKFLMARD